MKTITLSVLIMSTMIIKAQNEPVTSGKITYEEIIKIEIKLEGEAAAMAANFPKERRSEKILTFSEAAMLYEDGKSNVEEEMASQHGDGTMRIRMVTSGQNKIFTDTRNKKILEQRDFMNRVFLVERDMPALADWKMTGNQKSILGYNSIEAIKTDTAGNKTIVWFTPLIKGDGGPAGLGGLPGMILEADINSGSRLFMAKKVEAVDPAGLKLQKPKEGKQVTEIEYKKIVAEKLKEMGVEEGGDGKQMRVIIRHQ